MNITTKTEIGLEVYRAITRSATTGYKKISFRFTEVIFALVAVLCLGFGIYIKSNGTEEDSAYLGRLLIIVGIVYAFLTVLRLILRRLMPKMQMKAAANLGTRTQICTFGDESFTAEVVSDGAKSSSEIKYSAVYKVIEDNDYFFIFLTKQSVYPVSKAEMTDAEIEAVRDKLSSSAGEKKYVSRIK